MGVVSTVDRPLSPAQAQLTLLEEDDVLLVEAKEGLLSEERLGGCPCRPARHDEPSDPRAGPNLSAASLLPSDRLQPADSLSLVLEESLVRGEANVEAAFGGRGSETGALATGHEKDGHLRAGDGLKTLATPCGGLLSRVEDRCRRRRGQWLDFIVGGSGGGSRGGLHRRDGGEKTADSSSDGLNALGDCHADRRRLL